MKFELERLPRGASLEEIKEEIIRVAELISDTIITQKKFNAISKISTSTLNKKFGSWEKTLIECGLGHRYSGRTISSKMRSQVARNLPDAELISELKRVAQKLGKKELSQKDFNDNSSFSASAIARRLGSWSEGLKKSGLEEVKMAKRYTEQDYFENLLNVWTHYGRQPYYREMGSPPSIISSGGYERRWGRWSFAIKAFIEFVNIDKPVIEETPIERKIIQKISVKTERKNKRDIPLGLRYKVLSRDRFRCVKCGNSPATDLNCKLHIDHIIPFSKGGVTTFDNLQATCSNCNLGKGNRYNE